MKDCVIVVSSRFECKVSLWGLVSLYFGVLVLLVGEFLFKDDEYKDNMENILEISVLFFLLLITVVIGKEFGRLYSIFVIILL